MLNIRVIRSKTI